MYLRSKKKKIGLGDYSGKWVAFIDNQPLIYDSSLPGLMEKVKKSRLPKEPSVMLIPRQDEGPYIQRVHSLL